MIDKFFNEKGIILLKDTSDLQKLTDEGILSWFNKSIYNHGVRIKFIQAWMIF